MVLTITLLMLFVCVGQTFAAVDNMDDPANTDRDTLGNRSGTVYDTNRINDMNNNNLNNYNQMNDNGNYNGNYNGMNNDTVRANAVDGTDWGWLGLLGLIGLAGMFGRNREEREA